MERPETIEFLTRYSAEHSDLLRPVFAPDRPDEFRLLLHCPEHQPLPFVLHHFSTAPTGVSIALFTRILRLTEGVKNRPKESHARPLPQFVHPILLEHVARRALAAELPPDDPMQIWCFEAERRAEDVLGDDSLLFICRTASGSFTGHGINATFEGRVRFLDLFSAESGWTVSPLRDPATQTKWTIARITAPVDDDAVPIEEKPPHPTHDDTSPLTWRDVRTLVRIMFSVLSRLPLFIYAGMKYNYHRRKDRREFPNR